MNICRGFLRIFMVEWKDNFFMKFSTYEIKLTSSWKIMHFVVLLVLKSWYTCIKRKRTKMIFYFLSEVCTLVINPHGNCIFILHSVGFSIIKKLIIY